MERHGIWLIVAGVFGAMAVAAGAWAAHGLADNPTAQMWAETASRYQMLHGAVIAALALAPSRDGGLAAAAFSAARWLFTLGIVLFAGSLYMLATTGVAPFPGSAPIGGTTLIIGWLALAVAGAARLAARD